jgi:hypothetical protein
MRATPERGDPLTVSVDLPSRGDLRADHDAALRACLGASYGTPAYVCALLEGGIGVLVRGVVVAMLHELRLERDDGGVDVRAVDPTTWALICSPGDVVPRAVIGPWSRQLRVSVRQGLATRALRLVREGDAYVVRGR